MQTCSVTYLDIRLLRGSLQGENGCTLTTFKVIISSIKLHVYMLAISFRMRIDERGASDWTKIFLIYKGKLSQSLVLLLHAHICLHNKCYCSNLLHLPLGSSQPAFLMISCHIGWNIDFWPKSSSPYFSYLSKIYTQTIT